MKNKNLLVVTILFVVIFNSIVYSALNSEMFINGDAHIRVDKDIRITNVKVLEQVNNAYETYNNDYSKNTTSMQITLPNNESSMTYEVTITNKGDTDYEIDEIIEESYSNNNIKYELIDIEKGVVIDRGTTHTFKIKFTTIENNPDNKTTLVLKYNFKEWVPSLYNMVAHKSKALDTDIDFGVAPTIETSGVYEMNSTKDDEYPVYYYRGIIDNNNVNFAGFCWKIVRTTSTGGVKLIYNGEVASDGSCNNTGEASEIEKSAFNTSYTLNEDVSYIYDDGKDSTIKKVIDKWYSDNLLEYTNMLEDTIWCSDRNLSSVRNDVFETGIRNVFSSKPDVFCSNNDNILTVENKKLKYPIALLTGDELTIAGSGYNGYSNNSYLNIDTKWWTMSPHNITTRGVGVLYLTNLGKLVSDFVDFSNGVRPVISLASGTMIKEGNGSVSNPYKLVEDKITKEWSFDYTGGEQEFNVPYDGVYKLEVWGAQGGSYDETYYGGYGAYSTGNINLTKGTNLYINIGESGTNVCYRNYLHDGTYNGGGGVLEYAWTGNTAATECKGTGGGATHVSASTGKLLQLEDNLQAIYIVAGGGGAAEFYHSNNNDYSYCIGGSGGGKTGLLSTCYSVNIISSAVLQYTMATQEKGGIKLYAGSKGNLNSDGSFGLGATGYSGGGGGYYGGAGGPAGTGGGSSYIGNSLLTNKTMYCYNCQESSEESTKTVSTTNVSEEAISKYAKKKNGYAKITLVSKK